jgi:hypothetical protein
MSKARSIRVTTRCESEGALCRTSAMMLRRPRQGAAAKKNTYTWRLNPSRECTAPGHCLNRQGATNAKGNPRTRA